MWFTAAGLCTSMTTSSCVAGACWLEAARRRRQCCVTWSASASAAAGTHFAFANFSHSSCWLPRCCKRVSCTQADRPSEQRQQQQTPCGRDSCCSHYGGCESGSEPASPPSKKPVYVCHPLQQIHSLLCIFWPALCPPAACDGKKANPFGQRCCPWSWGAQSLRSCFYPLEYVQQDLFRHLGKRDPFCLLLLLLLVLHGFWCVLN